MGFFSKLSKNKQSTADRNKTLNKIALNDQSTKDNYDLSFCGLYELPKEFSYYYIDLHLKTGINFSNNKLSSLKANGSFENLQEIHVLNLSFNLFNNDSKSQ